MSVVITFGKSSGSRSKSKLGKTKGVRQSKSAKSVPLQDAFSPSFEVNRVIQEFFDDNKTSFTLSDRGTKVRNASSPSHGDGPGGISVASGGAAELSRSQFSESQSHPRYPGLVLSKDRFHVGLLGNDGKLSGVVRSSKPLSDQQFSQFEKVNSRYEFRSNDSPNESSTIVLSAPGKRSGIASNSLRRAVSLSDELFKRAKTKSGHMPRSTHFPSESSIPILTTPEKISMNTSGISFPEKPSFILSHSSTDQANRNSFYEKSISLFPKKTRKVHPDYSPVLPGNHTSENWDSIGGRGFTTWPFATGYQREFFASIPQKPGNQTSEPVIYERFTPLNFNNNVDPSVASAFYAIMKEPLTPLEKLKKLMEMMKLMEKMRKPHFP